MQTYHSHWSRYHVEMEIVMDKYKKDEREIAAELKAGLEDADV